MSMQQISALTPFGIGVDITEAAINKSVYMKPLYLGPSPAFRSLDELLARLLGVVRARGESAGRHIHFIGPRCMRDGCSDAII